jgi:hypothetical protein
LDVKQDLVEVTKQSKEQNEKAKKMNADQIKQIIRRSQNNSRKQNRDKTESATLMVPPSKNVKSIIIKSDRSG